MKRMSQALEGSTTRSLTPTLTPKSLSRVTSNAASDEVPVMALRGDVENTGMLTWWAESWYRSSPLFPSPLGTPLPPRARGDARPHLITRNLLAHYRDSEIQTRQVAEWIFRPCRAGHLRHDRDPSVDPRPGTVSGSRSPLGGGLGGSRSARPLPLLRRSCRPWRPWCAHRSRR